MTDRLRKPPRMRSIDIGDLTVTHVPDGMVSLKPRGWLPDGTEQDWAAHPEYLDAGGNLVAGIGGLLVEYGERALLIDAGVGPNAQPDDPENPLLGAIHGGDLLANLAKLGRTPEQIEAVAFTHLHADHTGWTNAFTEAAYLIARDEWEANKDDAPADRVRHPAPGEEIFPGVRVVPTPGHTPGHTAYLIGPGDQPKRLLAFGDAMHSPIQFGHPGWGSGVDHDTTTSAEHRHHVIAELLRPDTIGFGIHFADVAFGRVELHAGTPRWSPVDTTERN